MHSYHRKTIDTVEEWLSSNEEEIEDDNLDEDLKQYLRSTNYLVQGTTLLYGDETICQEEK